MERYVPKHITGVEIVQSHSSGGRMSMISQKCSVAEERLGTFESLLSFIAQMRAVSDLDLMSKPKLMRLVITLVSSRGDYFDFLPQVHEW